MHRIARQKRCQYNVDSKKSDSYQFLRQVMTKNRRYYRSWYTAFSFYGEHSKLDRVKTMGTRGKFNAI